jgi:hypothetical protein
MEPINVSFENNCAIVTGLRSRTEIAYRLDDSEDYLELTVRPFRIPAGGYLLDKEGDPSAYYNFPILDRIARAVGEAAQREINKIQKEMKNE